MQRQDPTGSHSSGKNIIVRHTIPVYQDAEDDVTDARVERSPFKVSSFFRTERCGILCTLRIFPAKNRLV